MKVLSYVDHLNPRIAELFTKQTGIDVQMTPFETIAQAIQKLTTAGLDGDVLIGVPKDTLGELVAAGLLRPLNHALLPNIGNLWSAFATPAGSFWDVGMRYSVPYSVWSMGIAYRIRERGGTGVAPSALPRANPYDIFWDATLAGKINLLDDPRQVVTLALLRGGVTGTRGLNTDSLATRTELLSAAGSAIADLATTITPTFSSQPAAVLAGGETSVSQAYSSDVLLGDRYPGQSQPAAIGYLYPHGKGEVGGDHMVILADGKNPDAASLFVNWLLDNDNSLFNFTWTGAQPPLTMIDSADRLVNGAPAALSGRYGSYAVVPPGAAGAVLTEGVYSRGWFGGLELWPDVQAQWLRAAPAALKG